MLKNMVYTNSQNFVTVNTFVSKQPLSLLPALAHISDGSSVIKIKNI
jgi:hypothetical protein